MRDVLRIAVAGVVLMGLGVGPAMGAISLVETAEPINATLAADGWMGIKLQLVASGTSATVAGMDFKNNVIMSGHSYVNAQGVLVINPPGPKLSWLFAPGETIGISGPLHQAWEVVLGESDPAATADGIWLASKGATDSAILSYNILSKEDTSDEDNNLQSGGDGSSFGVSPLTNSLESDGSGVDYGVGSYLTFSGAVHWQLQESTMDLAFLIVPAGTGDVWIRGLVLDNNVAGWELDTVLNPAGFGNGGATSMTMQAASLANVPEPGTVGVLGLGAVVLGRRRRGRS